MSKRVLITGSEGFTGKYVSAEFTQAGWEVWRSGLQPKPESSYYLQLDLRAPESLAAINSLIQPDVVVHLAAASFVAERDHALFYNVNVAGTGHLLETLSQSEKPPNCTILASSANIYGNSVAEVLKENSPLDPANHYAVSKVAMELIAKTYMNRLGIIITRPFNYTGVGQDAKFLVPKLVEHFKLGMREIELGNTDVYRDFSDVRDIAKYYLWLAENQPTGETFNLCSGQSMSIEQIIRNLETLTGHRVKVLSNPNYVRENEIKRLRGSNTKLLEMARDFAPINFQHTLSWMLSR